MAFVTGGNAELDEVLGMIASAHGSTFVQPPLRKGTREFMYAMLNLLGVTDASVHALVSEDDLCRVYATTKGNKALGIKAAQAIARKYGSNPLLDPVTTRPVTPTPPAPAPPSGEYATLTDLKNTRNEIDRANRLAAGDVRTDVKVETDALRRNLTETLLAFGEALPETVLHHVSEALKSLTPVTLNVVMPNSAPVVLGIVHKRLAVLIQMLGAGENVYLHGPAGSGKTTAGRQCADAFGLPFYFAAKVESEYMLLGYTDARGETVRTQFREAYEHGGVFLFDELDGSSPGAVVALNAALANGICPFPDGVIVRHENFKCIGAGNTKLGGASRQYTGRQQLDAASIDRFAFMEWNYDDALEAALATNTEWLAYVQAARKAVADRGLPHLITPRATFSGCKLLAAGIDRDEVECAVLWKGLDSETVDQLIRAMPRSVTLAA